MSGYNRTKEDILDIVAEKSGRHSQELSDEELMRVSGGANEDQPSAKFSVGDRVYIADSPETGPATIRKVEGYFMYIGWVYVVEPDSMPGFQGHMMESELIPA